MPVKVLFVYGMVVGSAPVFHSGCSVPGPSIVPFAESSELGVSPGHDLSPSSLSLGKGGETRSASAGSGVTLGFSELVGAVGGTFVSGVGLNHLLRGFGSGGSGNGNNTG